MVGLMKGAVAIVTIGSVAGGSTGLVCAAAELGSNAVDKAAAAMERRTYRHASEVVTSVPDLDVDCDVDGGGRRMIVAVGDRVGEAVRRLQGCDGRVVLIGHRVRGEVRGRVT